MAHRWRQLHHHLLARVPFSRVRGVRAASRGQGDRWVLGAEHGAAWLDVVAAGFLLASAGLALAGAYWMSVWLIGAAVLSLGGAMFSMAATLWIDRQIQVVLDHMHLHLGGGRRSGASN